MPAAGRFAQRALPVLAFFLVGLVRRAWNRRGLVVLDHRLQ